MPCTLGFVSKTKRLQKFYVLVVDNESLKNKKGKYYTMGAYSINKIREEMIKEHYSPRKQVFVEIYRLGKDEKPGSWVGMMLMNPKGIFWGTKKGKPTYNINSDGSLGSKA